MLLLQQSHTDIANLLLQADFKEVAEFFTSLPAPSGEADVKITFIICATIVISIIAAAVATCYCVREACKARLAEQDSRQKFEIEKIEKAREAQVKDREADDKRRDKEREWKLEDEGRKVKTEPAK